MKPEGVVILLTHSPEPEPLSFHSQVRLPKVMVCIQTSLRGQGPLWGSLGSLRPSHRGSPLQTVMQQSKHHSSPHAVWADVFFHDERRHGCSFSSLGGGVGSLDDVLEQNQRPGPGFHWEARMPSSPWRRRCWDLSWTVWPGAGKRAAKVRPFWETHTIRFVFSPFRQNTLHLLCVCATYLSYIRTWHLTLTSDKLADVWGQRCHSRRPQLLSYHFKACQVTSRFWCVRLLEGPGSRKVPVLTGSFNLATSAIIAGYEILSYHQFRCVFKETNKDLNVCVVVETFTTGCPGWGGVPGQPRRLVLEKSLGCCK